MGKAGVKVQAFNLKEISYSPVGQISSPLQWANGAHFLSPIAGQVIAAAMLKRQQAQATIMARQAIVSGAVDIATSAVTALRDRHIELSPADATRIVTNLLTVLTSETEVHPTLALQ